MEFHGKPCQYCGAEPQYETTKNGMRLPLEHRCREKREFLLRKMEYELANPNPVTLNHWRKQMNLSPQMCVGGLGKLDIDDDNREAITACQQMVKDFRRGKRDGWIYLWSPELGTGKTTITQNLAFDIANQTGPYYPQGYPEPLAVFGDRVVPYWWDVPTFFQTWKENFKDESDFHVIRIINTPFLILDEFGNDRSTAFNVDSLSLIVNTRYRLGLPLVLSGNYAPTDLEWRVEEITHGNTQAIEQIQRIVARIRQRSNIIRLGGKDRRAKGARP